MNSTDMFETQRLLLRGLRKADLHDMFEIHTDYEVQKTAGARYVVPRPEETQKANLEEWATKCTLFAVAEDKETGKYVGDVCLRIDNPKDKDAEVGIVVWQKSWGKGYGTEMMRWLVDYAFVGLGVRRLSLTTLGSNNRATTVYKKVGFVEEGRKRKAIWREGRYVDEITMGILGEDFWASKSQTTEA